MMKYYLECRQCGKSFTKELVSDQSQPCPNCDSVDWCICVMETLEIPMPGIKLKGKMKETDQKRPTIEFEGGHDLYRESGKWNKKKRLIDRKEDKYEEIITDSQTGEVIHHCEEKLTEHQGHGSAKTAKRKP
ncbi:MAG: hypothetical protein A2158_02275 [Chloroflexi bacterium RBG_13_46_14]|nr:MAG: hypothetical protein A2158_02275 [Chloroflexi bacterium RBG_13_46_14]